MNHAELGTDHDERELGTLALFGLAAVAGALGALGSFVFLAVIGLAQNLFLLGRVGIGFDPHAPIPPSPWGPGIVLVPVIGALGVIWITRHLSREVRGSGVPEVLYAIHYRGGRMRPSVAATKALASALSIGTGASVGREGPIVQIGAILGAGVGLFARLPARQRIVLLAAGAAAGIAATFNAALGGLAFAIELLLVSVSARNVALVATATAVAGYLAGVAGGFGPLFPLAESLAVGAGPAGGLALLLWLPFGVVAGLAATGLENGIARAETFAADRVANPYLRHAGAMLLVGLMLYAFVRYTGQYHVAGVGYPAVDAILTRALADPGFLALLFAAKLAATVLALGTGASGGIFAPALFLGATLGAAYAAGLEVLLPGLGPDPVVGAIAGMAAVVGAATAAVVTAVVMVLELTHGYAALLPAVLSVSLAYIVRARLTRESIYTQRLAREGRDVPQGLQAALTATRDARRIMSRGFDVVERGRLREWIEGRPGANGTRYAVVEEDGAIAGLARAEEPYILADRDPEALVQTGFVLLPPETPWSTLMRALRAEQVEVVLVADTPWTKDLLGVITAHEIALAARDHADVLE